MFISHQPFTQGLLLNFCILYSYWEGDLFLLKQMLCHHPAPIHMCACSPTPPPHTHTHSFLSEISASHRAPLENCPHTHVYTLTHTHTLSLFLLSEISASCRAPLENCPGSSKTGLLTRLPASVAASSNSPRVSGPPPAGSGALLPAAAGCWPAGPFPSLSSTGALQLLFPGDLLAWWAHSSSFSLWRASASLCWSSH